MQKKKRITRKRLLLLDLEKKTARQTDQQNGK